jgi:hypothetical protein
MNAFLLMFNDNLIHCPWVQRNLPTESFVDVKADCISDVLMDASTRFGPHPYLICGDFNHDPY